MKTALALAATLMLAACANQSQNMTASAAPAQAASVEIYKSDGSRQCESNSGQSPEQMQAEQLVDIQVLSARKGALQGMAFPAVCGGMTGDINIYTIPATDLEKARSRGFERWQPQR